MTLEEVMKEASLPDLAVLQSEAKSRLENAENAFWHYTVYRDPEKVDEGRLKQLTDQITRLKLFSEAVSKEVNERINFILNEIVTV